MAKKAPRITRRKSRKAPSIMTIPELRRSFEHMESCAEQLVVAVLAKKKSIADASAEYAREWKHTFHRNLPAKSARATLEMTMATRKGQKGGMAPVGAELQPGVYSAPTIPGQVDAANYTLYSQVPAYVSSGFDTMTWQPSHQVLCGKEDLTPQLPADLGSNVVMKGGDAPWPIESAVSPADSKGALTIRGGKRLRSMKRTRRLKGGNAALSLAFRPLGPAVPTSPLYDAQMAWKGQPLPASPDPTDTAIQYKMGTAATDVPTITGM
jgi:hypothetical protein